MRVWIGLVGVRKLAGCQVLGEEKGAFVNVLTAALSAQDYELKVRQWAQGLSLFVEEIEDPEPFRDRTARWEVEEELIELSIQATDNPSQVFFGTFHGYLHDDA